MATKKISTVSKIFEKVEKDAEKLKAKAAAISANEAADQSMSSVEVFLKRIGDNELSLKDNVVEDNLRAILIVLVNHFEEDDYKILIVCYNKVRKEITSIRTFNREDSEKIQRCIRSKILGNFEYMNIVTTECERENCTYSFKDGIIYYSGENGDQHVQIDELNKRAYEVSADILKKAEKSGKEIYKLEIDDTEYAAFNVSKEDINDMLGADRLDTYSILATLGFIYTKYDGTKTRYVYRERPKDENGKVHNVYYFSINLEKLASVRAEIEMKDGE